MKQIPKGGLRGTRMVEAAAGEFRAIMGLVRSALEQAIFGSSGEEAPFLNITAVYADRVVVVRDGRLYAYPYTLDDANQVLFGAPVEVVEDHTAVTMREAAGAFIEALDAETGKPPRFLIRVIKAGLSGNKIFYPDAVLREATGLFDGSRVFAKSDEEHLAGKGKNFNQLIGRLSASHFIEGDVPDSGEVRATLDVLENAGGVAAKLRESVDRGMSDLFGFSIDALGHAKRARGQRIAESINLVKSVDLIIEPGAGGQLINLIEALDPEEQSDMKLRERMIEAVKTANTGALPAGLDVADDEALDAAYREALKPAAVADPGTQHAAPAAPVNADGATLAQVDERIKFVEARAYARTTIAAAQLPALAKTRLQAQFGPDVNFTEAAVDQAITDEREYLGKVSGGGRIEGLGDTSMIESGEQQADKTVKMLDAFFDKKNAEVSSFKECYIAITGDTRVTGDMRQCDRARLREAVGAEFREALDSTSFSNVLGDTITRRMVADYNVPGVYDVWRSLADVTPVSDFRTQERTRFGGYGDLPAVAQSAPYAALTSPGDEKATYAVTKRGGTETVTLEMIKNDDAGAIQRIPVKLSRAAKRTLGKFVLDFIRTNPAIYDTVALFHATHANLGAAALDATSLAAARLAMLKQTEAGSLDRLGIPARNLWVPGDLEEAAFDLFRRTTNNDTDFVESLQMQVHPVWYWTDANDWAASADFNDIPTIEIGFLDGNQEPELFVQDSPTNGSLFSNDQVTYKIRHIYGGNVLDFRGMYKAVVA